MTVRENRCEFINQNALVSISLAQENDTSLWHGAHKGHITIALAHYPSVLLYDEDGLSVEKPIDFYKLEQNMVSIEGVDRVSGSLQQGHILLSIKEDADAYEVIKPAINSLLELGCINQSELPRIYSDLGVASSIQRVERLKSKSVSVKGP